ncbi:hypothetical protein, partial [Bacteroides sp.]|uniref:hypothetical protein n=1 Tax=Bacteroides sp. TaxID=29523 RepID=UPI0025C3E5BC
NEKNQEINEKNQEINEKNQEINEKNQKLNEKNQELNEKMLVIKDMAKMLYEQGIPPEIIAERFNLDSELLKSFLK